MAKNRRRTQKKRTEQSRRQVKRIDILPDDVLLDIFDFYVDKRPPYLNKTAVEAWQSLVHVCRRWRNIVLGSPRRLNLQLYCTPGTTRDTLSIWPALPLIIEGFMDSTSDAGTDNIVAALGQSNRIRRVSLLYINGSQLEQVLAAMQAPFPELTDLQLFPCVVIPVIPDSFLGGSAPRLRTLFLYGIPFPGLPKLLLTATHLIELNLYGIPLSGYISPEAIVAPLSVLSSLEKLTLKFQFQFPQSSPHWERQSLPPLKRSILPALHEFRFEGTTDYLESLVALIDAPQLDEMEIIIIYKIDFDCSQLAQFFNHSPSLWERNEAHVQFNNFSTSVALLPSRAIRIEISCVEPDRQLPSIAQVCNSTLPTSSRVEDLHIKRELDFLPQFWNNDAIETTLWLQLLLPFTAVKNLYLSDEIGPVIGAALKELVGGRITEVLPRLQNIFVEKLEPSGPFQENIGEFVAARQISDHPIAISVWDRL